MSTRVIGYTYRAENYTPEGLAEQMLTEGTLSYRRYSLLNIEEGLDLLAKGLEINRNDESSFDSSDFPKVILGTDGVDEDSLTPALRRIHVSEGINLKNIRVGFAETTIDSKYDRDPFLYINVDFPKEFLLTEESEDSFRESLGDALVLQNSKIVEGLVKRRQVALQESAGTTL